MTATNLTQYAHMFLSNSMNGRILLGLDEMKLVQLGIHDEFHRKMILSCVNELIGNSETVSVCHFHDIKHNMKGVLVLPSFFLLDAVFCTITPLSVMHSN